jgi:DNA-binding FadR family transcriptional regulator
MDKIDYTVYKTKLYEQIADTLEQAIVRSERKLEKLPAENELAKRFKVSRTVVREALKVLQERSLIESRNGEGSYISRPKSDTVSNAVNRIIRMDKINDNDLHHTRIILESAGVRLAALYSVPEELERLEKLLGEMETAPIPEGWVSLDSQFHRAIIRMGRNELLSMFVEVMTALLHEYMIKGINPADKKSTIDQHRCILDAIRAKDPDAAEKALISHLTAAHEMVAGYDLKNSHRT